MSKPIDFPKDRNFEEEWLLHQESAGPSPARGVLIYAAKSFSTGASPFLVLAGSGFRRNERDSIKPGSKEHRIREHLKKNQFVGKNGKAFNLVFLQDVIFSAPSTAASVITGAKVSGPKLWRLHKTPNREINCSVISMNELNPDEMLYFKRPAGVFDTSEID